MTDDLRQRIAQLSPERLALLLQKSQGPAGTTAAAQTIVPRADASKAPLSFLQRRLWFLDRLESGSPLYNMHAAFRITGNLDRDALAASFGEMARRHETLRTRFDTVGGEPVQVVEPEAAAVIEIELVDLEGQPEEGEEQVRSEAGRPFDLSQAPLLRVLLVRLGDTEHLISVAFHHIISDGWSIGVFMRELAVLYEAFAAGRPSPSQSPLPDLPIQYADYAAWQQAALTDAALAEHVAYWKEALAGAPELLELPADRPRPAVRSPQGAAVDVLLTPELTERLHRLAAEESSTLYMVLLSGFQALLSRLSGQDDVLVGSPAAGRDFVETEGVIGPFVNTVVRRARFDGDPSFKHLLADVRAGVLAADPHAGLPFEKLVEALAPERSPSYTPVFQTWLVLHNVPMPTLELPGITLSPIAAHGGTAKFDLTLEVGESAGEVRGFFEHSLDLFDSVTVERWARHLAILLHGATVDGETPVSALPLLSEGEVHQLLAEWRSEAAAPASSQFAAAAGASEVAVRLGWEELTHEELEGRSNQLARVLRSRGAGPEVAVGLCVERSIDMVVGLLAILKAGAVAVPLDPKYPAERLEGMLEDSGAGLLLTQQALLFDLPPAFMALDLFCFDTDSLEEQSREPLEETFPEESLAYLIFTSGSTGTPKAVGVSRGALATHLAGVRDAFGLTASDRVLQFTSLSFDVALEQILTAIQAGATLFLRGEEVWSAQELDRQILDNDLTVANLPTGFWQQWLSETEGMAPSSLRLMIAGGDAMSPGSVRRWLDLPIPPRLLNAYGPTEGVITASVHDVPQEEPGIAIPIGSALPGRRLYVLDRSGRPAAPGVAGELCLAGPLLARGYVRRPDLTAESFVPDPFAGREGARMYRTGDLVRRRADGSLEFLGRRDRQVKVRGFRIELGEIEEALRRHPDLKDAVAVLHGSGSEEKRIVAYVVSADASYPPSSPSSEDLRSSLEARLPPYMLPSVFVPLAEIPLTPNGKLDRRALPDPDADRGDREEGAVAPRTPLEETMMGLWEEVGLSPAGIHDDFFELGGHSLLGTLVISRVIEAFGVELPLQSLFANPTVASFTARVEAALAEGKDTAPPIEPVPRDGDLPLSFAQQRLWFLEQVDPGTPVYVLPAAVRLAGPLDTEALERSVQEVVRRHEVLRTTFVVPPDSDQPVQVIAPDLPIALERIDLADLAPEDREEKMLDLAVSEVRQPFDLAAGPLLRLRLLHLGEDEHMLLLILHHIVADGWSLDVLLREVAELYPAFAKGETPSLPPLAIQYGDFAVWQRSWLQGEELERQLAYWRRELEGVPALELPFALPQPERPSHRGTFKRFEIDADLAQELRELSHREGVTLYMTLLGTFETLLYRLSGQEVFSLGTGIANRNRARTEDLIGFFVNTLVLRADLSGNPTGRELLERVRTAALGAYAHQDLPFERLVEELRPGRELARSPLFQVMFLFQNTPMPPLRVGDLDLIPQRLDTGTSHFDLTLELEETPEGEAIPGVVEYGTDRYDEGTVDALIDRFKALLREVAIAPDLPVLDLPLSEPASVPGGVTTLNDEFVFEAGD